ncbi:sulfatase family protein [Deinococcus yavapaiensis]|uniref:Arylsulfatase A-like enzyme n=1 Tax=Deinococcus yavapaiensis KR-236 TaxID=694435 RepID=A0A318SBP4_9DEIO|nr:sulfatase-like hydrolase/transferase [Deinococcus yavapaiensis]PYE54621.1 arylsulfatase A-like enzyme [Deinococcus yavapaiensis KR-236]
MTAALRPNIILVTTDQQRYDALGANGSPFMTTPALDELSAEGVAFDRAYCPNPVCTPSRLTLMTGQFPSRHGGYNIGTTAIDKSRFLSVQLRAAGYRTHHVGKAHWHPWSDPSPERAPVDERGTPWRDFVGFETAELATGHVTWGVTGHYQRWLDRRGVDKARRHELNRIERRFESDPNETGDWGVASELHSGAWILERALAFLDSSDDDRPFFLNLGFQDPHHPHAVPFDFEARVNEADLPPRIDGASDVGVVEPVAMLRAGTINASRYRGRFEVAGNAGAHDWRAYFHDEAKDRGTRAAYYSLVNLFDSQFARIMRAVRRRSARPTVVVFTSDHGDMLGDHDIGQKGPLAYEAVLRVPLIVWCPQLFAPRRVSDVVSLVDLSPTLLNLGGANLPASDGVDLRATLERGEAPGRAGARVEFKEEPDRVRYKAWITRDFKLVVYPGETFGELYDLQDDPEEHVNRFDDSALAEVKARLLTELLSDMERSEPHSERPSRV